MPSILIVDDKEQNLYLLQALLTGHGYEVVSARNGAEALMQAAEKVPDLVIADILMPVMDGFTLCRRWKADVALRDVPFVFYTATYTDPRDQQLALSLGADRFIIKPIEPADFIAQIAEVLEVYQRGQLHPREGAAAPEALYLRQYSAVLVHKLEDKLVQLEEANRRLLEKDAFNLAVLNAMTALVAVIDPRGEVLSLNEAWARAAARGGPAFVQLRVGEDALAASTLREGLCDVLDGGHAQRDVELPYGAEDAPQWYMVRIERVAKAGVGAIIACIDITERKRAEQAVAEAARRKDDFLALLGHELRNPLAPIKTASHVFKLLHLPDPRAERAREIIDRQVSHLAHIVDDLLDVSRIARGKLVMKYEPTDWAQVVRSTASDHATSFEARGISLHVTAPATPVWVRGDATRLTQIVANLLDNAQKFTNRGGHVELQLEVAADEQWGSLVVRDTGVGMTPQTLTRIFEPFEQAQQSSARTRGGFGMGLALVKGLVEMHCGEVRATSAGLGHGAELRVRIPLTEEPAFHGIPVGATGVEGAGVLVIEDNHDAADSLCTLLEMSGCQVQVAYDGPSGLDLARARPPETILCDIGLPGSVDGYAVARAVRADPVLRGIRLIALTGYGQAEDRRRAREAGFDAHVTKPADPAQLLDMVGRAHERHAP